MPPTRNPIAWEGANSSYSYEITRLKHPEDVTDLAEQRYYNSKDASNKEKRTVSKTYQTIKEMISLKFKKDSMCSASLNELNNATIAREDGMAPMHGLVSSSQSPRGSQQYVTLPNSEPTSHRLFLFVHSNHNDSITQRWTLRQSHSRLYIPDSSDAQALTYCK